MLRRETPARCLCVELSGELAFGAGVLICLGLCMLSCGFPIPALAQAQHPSAIHGATSALDGRGKGASAGTRQPDRQLLGYISGTVLDKSGAVALGAQVRLVRELNSSTQEVLSGNNGQFSFADLTPGAFQIPITAEGFESQRVTGTLRSGETYIVPEIRLPVATVVTEVRVGAGLTPLEQAQDQVKEQEKQRVFGFIPPFYVSYVPDAVPLAPRQKFQLAWKSTIDPFTFVGVGTLAGVQQATNAFAGYGQGAQG
jgi:hypothetical protein